MAARTSTSELCRSSPGVCPALQKATVPASSLAADESGRVVYAAGGGKNAPVQLQGQLGQSLVVIDVLGGK